MNQFQPQIIQLNNESIISFNMAATHSNVTVEFELKDKSESNSHHESQSCCVQMDTHIQTLVNDVKTLHEIVNIRSEEWR